MSTSNLPTIAIVGRPNVGKSALFNRIVGRRISIVHEQSGVTRDRIAARASHGHSHFLLVDTGGLGVPVKELRRVDLFGAFIRDQVVAVAGEADVIILVTDVQDGLTPLDAEVADFLRSAGNRVIVAANKADNEQLREAADAEFAALGFAAPMPISCLHRRGIDELLDACVASLPVAPEPDDKPELRLAVVGRPNVGKSSLVNRLLGEERVMVSEIPGTTRDAVDVPFQLRGDDEIVPVSLIDTAGLRRKRRVDTPVEFFSVARAEAAIRRCDIVLFMMEATAPATAQDRRIAKLIGEHRKPCIMLANKWDLMSGKMKQRELEAEFRHGLPFMQHAPLECVCAVSGYNVGKIIPRLFALREQMQVMIPTAVVNRFTQDTVARTPPGTSDGKTFKILYGTMAGNPPPHFILFVNHKSSCPANYLQFLENQIRKAFFPEAGLPIWLELRDRRPLKDKGDGSRQAIAGVMRDRARVRAAGARHNARRKGWRKKQR